MSPILPKPATRGQRLLLAALALGLLALVVHTIFGEHGYLALRQQQREYERLRQEIQSLQEENQRLEEEIKVLRSDPRALERVAREELKMARPGEKVYSLPQNPEAESPITNPTNKKP
ncbi:MAG: septum formation initiator family protein [Acidobacteria bacterium]|nr:septum formation initiator family protein [Acidobacteriota bacterium]